MEEKNKNNTEKKSSGSALVAGAGISGMACALNLADSGFKVYLIDSAPAIGGKMVTLDKTFPTGDCAMCTVSPRLTDCARNDNIEIITGSRVKKIAGAPGHFTVLLRKTPGYVDPVKCNACGDCEKACPVELDNAFDSGLSKRKAIYKYYPQAVPNTYTIDKDGASPCRVACPAGVNAHAYVALIRAGKFAEALAVVREAMPFASVCGRICTHPCETECSRAKIDSAVSICSLKRFIADYEKEKSPPVRKITAPLSGKSAAIIGSGPAGLTCAYHLAKIGYKVTVFEALSVPGGMLRVGIPDFRLPPEIVDKEIEFIKNTGVEIKTNINVGKDISFDDLREREQYKAIFIAVGATKSQRLKIEGEDLEGVHFGIDFLMAVKSGKEVKIGDKVIVIGGGNTAFDAARTALRLGAKEVTIVYRRSREEMPAIPSEIEQAEKEGVKIEYLTGPLKINGDNKKVKRSDPRKSLWDEIPEAPAQMARGFTPRSGVTSLSYIKMKLGEPDESGRRSPAPIKGTEAYISTDTVIIAIGQYSDINFLSAGLKDEKGNIKLDIDTLATAIPGVFAGGDVVSGPDVLIKAIAAGRKAAISIDRYLKGEQLLPVVISPAKKTEKKLKENVEKQDRVRIEEREINKRKGDFKETDWTLTEEMAVREAGRCLDCSGCSECLECIRVCAPEAICHSEKEKEIRLETGAVILSPGLSLFDPGLKPEFGYGRYKDVVTGAEYERILSASGPYGGIIKRPSDGKTPQKIAFIQCVGSRDSSVSREYCSAVCCMYTAKEAIVTREHFPEMEVSVFFIDIRAYGKGYEAYYERAKKEYGIKYIRSSISKVFRNALTGKLKVRYINDSPENINRNQGIREEEFDLVVLATGLGPSKTGAETACAAGLELDKYNFPVVNPDPSTRSFIPGILTSGSFNAPKDIPESVTDGLASAATVSELLSESRNTETVKKEYPAERDIAGEKERIGVFICHCGRNIASVVDVKKICSDSGKIPGVVYAETNLFTCSPDGLERIRKMVAEHKLNRVVVASCTPRTHEVLFQENLREAGLNPYLFEMANIRDQCAWPHSSEPGKATDKAGRLVKMAAAKVRYHKPLQVYQVPVTPKALVLGGGISGMTAALSLAVQGFEIFLIEKEEVLGGNLRKMYKTAEGLEVQNYLAGVTDRILKNPKIQIFTGTELTKLSGFIGNFKTRIRRKKDGREEELSHGVVIVATGGAEYLPEEYAYGKDKRVVTQRELEKLIKEGRIQDALPKNATVAMLQCVGSRDEKHPYCSRVCCTEAVQNSLLLKEVRPDLNIYVLHHDIRTYGKKELLYQKARELGVLFLRHTEDKRPGLEVEEGRIKVRFTEDSIKEEMNIEADLLVLSAGIAPNAGNRELSSLLKLCLSEDEFFMEAHVKLRPVDFTTEGVFLCGLAHSPKFLEENIAQARAASARAVTILAKGNLTTGGIISSVEQEKCIACLTCVRVCPYGVPAIDAEGAAYIEPASCRGCGICASECPAKAIKHRHFEDEEILASIIS